MHEMNLSTHDDMLCGIPSIVTIKVLRHFFGGGETKPSVDNRGMSEIKHLTFKLIIDFE